MVAGYEIFLFSGDFAGIKVCFKESQMFTLKKTAVFAVLLLAALMFAGCGTTAKAASKGEERPDWIDNYPVDSAYYTGIGSSNTGNKSADMETAKARALTDLASAISVQISSEQEFVVKEDSAGNSYQSAEVQINQAVSNNFTDVEVFDSFYSEKSGYWFYYKLSKAKWAEIQRREKAAIEERVKSIITPVYEASDATAIDKITALSKGWDIVAQSPYEGTINSFFRDESGLLIDLIEMNMGRITKDLELSVIPSEIKTEPGRFEDIDITVRDVKNGKTGQVKVGFYIKSDMKKVAEIVTESDGTYRGKIKFTGLPTGKNDILAAVAFDNYGIKPDLMKSRLTAPEKEIKVQMDHISVLLKLLINGDFEIESLKDSVKTLFSRDEFAVKLSDGGKNERFTINFSMYFRNMPENSYGLFLTRAKASVSLLKDGSNIYSYETKEYKEGGLDWDQAQERATIKLFKDINADNDFIMQMSNAIYKAAEESSE